MVPVIGSRAVLFSVLGPLRVIDADGVDVTPRGEQQRRMLEMLAITAPAPVSVDVLEELLWGGPAPSANALQALVSKLRKVIDPVRIERDPRGYLLAGQFATDVDEFERLVAAGDHAGAERLVRGEPLADLADVSAVAAERARLAEMIRAARRRRLEALVEGADAEDASAELESLVAAEPLEESWWALLMRAQYGCGQQAEALRTFQRARRVLAEELGLNPGSELQQLEHAVLDGAAPHPRVVPTGLP